MPLADGDKGAGWAVIVLLVAIVAFIAATMVWLVGPPSWRGSLVAIACVGS